MDPRFFAAKLSSQLFKAALQATGSGGTAAPGLLASYLDPKSLKKLRSYISDVIIVTGTNGKTTTARLVGAALESSGTPFIHNREGSNLLRGVTGSLITKTPLFPGQVRPHALLEVDEATLPHIIAQTTPKIIVLNNLFRDQLDRYGEIETVRKIWQETLKNLDESTTLILNSDDPSVSFLGRSTKARVVYFGLEDKGVSTPQLPHASDFTNCVYCSSELKYDYVYMSHLGKYRCTNCGKTRPKPDVFAKEIKLGDELGFSAKIVTPEESFQIKTRLPGLYNVYNCLSAISVSLVLNLSLPKIIQTLKSFEPAFGRTEIIEVAERKLFLALAKNPAGFNELLKTLFAKKKKRNILIAINDLIADGKDVSWLWDVDFELMKGKLGKTYISGVRSADMSLRLKYAGIETTSLNSNLGEALDEAYANTEKGDTLFVLATYTAMLEIKKHLTAKGYGKGLWKD